MLPQADVSPAPRRATRALLRRRLPLAHNRAALLAHVPNTTSQSTLPALGKKIASKAHRDGVAARFPDAAVHKSIEVARALIPSDEALLRDVELTILQTAPHHEAHPLYLRQTVPGLGKRLSLGLLDAIQPSNRFPRVQDVVSSGRLVTCATSSAGKRLGTSGATRGQAHLQWAFAAAAVVCLSDHPAAQQSRARLEKKPDQGQAFTLRAHKLARAVSSMLTRQVAFERETCFPRAGRGAEEPEASLDNQGVNLPEALERAAGTASVHAHGPRGHETRSPAPVMGQPLSLLVCAARVAHGLRGLLRTRAGVSLDNVDALSPILAEDGRRARRNCSVAERAPTRLCPRRLGVESTSRRVWCSHVRSAPLYGNHVRTHNRLLTAPGPGQRKKSTKPLTGVVCLLTTGVLIRVGQPHSWL
jgi:hypothetical protein